MERKIAWMQQLQEHVGKRSNLSGRCVLAGDFNVVSDGPALRRTLNCTPRERDALDAVLGLGLVDLYRRHHPDIGTGFNYGFDIHKPVTARLHRIVGTGAVAGQLCDAWVDLEYRRAVEELRGCAWPQSAPVIVDLSSRST